jgi:hypothetical protein
LAPGQVFSFRCENPFSLLSKFETSKQPISKLKTQSKPLLGSLQPAFTIDI